jgi:hypothetical protein
VSDPDALALLPGEGLLISEHGAAGDTLERTQLIARDGRLLLAVLRHTDANATDDVEAVGELPAAALDAVMRRYGKPLAPEVPEPKAALILDGGAVVSTFRHLARYDVIARDYVYYRADADSDGLAALSVTVAAALRFLALRP